MAIYIYGIANCDTICKARAWLDARGVAYRFHDYRKAGVDRDMLGTWVNEFGWEALLNRSGTTFRKLPDAEKAGLDAARAIDLMVAHPAMIRRPLLDTGDVRLVGFSPERYADAFAARAGSR